jgi:hypothetical protein
VRTLLVTAYTPGYRDLYERLAESCKAHSAELWAMPYESTGSWEKNGHVKPRALLEAMRQHPGRPVCWVDADAVLRAPPVLLDQLPSMTDAAWHTIPKTGEDLSGTVWTCSEKFCLAWEWALAGTDMWDQKALREAAKACAPCCIQTLPAEYCWIDFFAEKRWGGPRTPVIEHTQASREVRAGKRAM